MPIAGLNFDKLLAEKKKPVRPPLKIDSNLKIVDLKKSEIPTPKGEGVIRFDFEFRLDYNPKIAEIVVGGHALYSDKEKEINKILVNWKKDRKVDPELMRSIINVAIVRSNMKAILLAEQVNLPPHIKFPTIVPKGKSDYIG